MTFVVLTGASGSGKTTIARDLAERHGDRLLALHFDAIGVPSIEAMIAEHGSPTSWQRAKTFEWMERLMQLERNGRPVLFEGQMRLTFVAEGAAAAGGPSYTPILVDCSDATRTRRLTVDRGQPELADEEMLAWAAWLRREATDEGIPILDTSHLTIDEASAHVARHLGL